MRTVAKLATVVFFSGILALGASAKKTSSINMKTPDFAYPKTVEKKASAELEQAMADGDWPAAVDAMIQTVTAANIVSRNQAPSGIAKIDSVAAIAPDEWRPAFMLMEADIYNSIYNSIQWKANNRKIPTDSVPVDPYEWSRDIFALKVFDLCKNILTAKIPDTIHLKDWNKFIDNVADAYANGMTVEEFLCERCFSLLNSYADASKDVIPFFSNPPEDVTPGQKCAVLRDYAIDRLIDSAASGKRMLILANALSEKANTLPYSMRMKALLYALDMVKGSEGEQLILGNLRDYLVEEPVANSVSAFPYSTKEYIEMLRRSLSDLPKGMYANSLRNIINDLTRPFADISYNSQYLSSTEISMDVTLNNCNQSWVLVYDYAPYVGAQRSPKTKDVAARCRLVKAVMVNAAGEVPFTANVKAEIGMLPKGTYVVIPSSSSSGKGIYPSILDDSWRQPFSVSDISIMTLQGPDASTRVFVADGANGKPIEGATVKVYSKKNYSSPRKLIDTLTTDKDGSVTVLTDKFEIEAYFDGSKWSNDSRYYNSSYRQDTTSRHFLQILADRAICHPGDSIKAAVIAYSSQRFERKLDKGCSLKILLLDANSKEVASKTIVTDSFGRATVEFKIPEQGLLGNWQLSASDENRRLIDRAYVQVADYVAPTFFIESEHSDEDVAEGDVVALKGRVLTYSGMPVAGAVVKYNVSYRPPMRWFMTGYGTFDSSVTTDEEGKYEIELPTENLKGTQFERGVFSVKLSATSPAGETQTGPTERFAIGKEYNIQPSLHELIFDVTDSIPEMLFYVKDMLGRNVKKELTYRLVNEASKTVVAEGKFTSPVLALTDKDYPSALYDLQVVMKEDSMVKASTPVIFWRKTDKTAPEGVNLWVPQKNVVAGNNSGQVNVTVGSGVADRWIPAVLSADGEIISMQWLHVEKDNLSVPVVAPVGEQKYQLNLSYLSDLKWEMSNISILPASYDDKLQVTVESFRDKVSAGDKEKWSFRFKKKTGNAYGIPAMAVMTDAALNAIAPFNWNFNPRNNGYPTFYRMNGDFNRKWSINANLRNSKYLSSKAFTFPRLNDYGQDWGFNVGMYYDGGVAYVTGGIKNEVAMMRSAAPMAMKMSANTAVETVEYAMDDMAVVEEEAEEGISIKGTGNAGAHESEDAPELRDTECPVAFFMPYLVSDKDGFVNVEFTVPNFNTTWAFQLIGYDQSLQIAKTSLETVASKAIMVSTHAPRFVRTGDVIELTATVFNNTGAGCAPKCRIELVDLISGKMIASKDFKTGPIEIAGSCVISMPWTVPSDVSAVGFRAYAEAENHRDGEQALLPVLPASSPVVESTPFWIAPEGETVEVKLPKFKDTDQVTLQYCDNPAWYCISALPDIVVPDSKSVTAKMKALYGNTVAYHLISSNANLKKGLEVMLSDSNSQFAALKSNLEKDGNLKIVQLSNSPWVNNAESETLRMSRLSSLLNDSEAKTAINRILDDIRGLQDKDGGWSWCPDMESSPYITQEILRQFSMIMKAGAMKLLDGSESMVKSALRYVDSEKVRDYKKYHKKGESLSYLLDWLYIRSAFPADYLSSGTTARDMSAIAARACKDIAAEWKDMGIGAKAKAAAVLWRAGDHKSANEILESLRQYATEKPEKGMWFDNVNSGWGGMSVLQTTTLVLEAFAEIQPNNKIIDSLRQWLVLGRQYQDWGKRTSTVETVNAILTSGSDWYGKQAFQSATSENFTDNSAEFRLKGKKVEIPVTAKMTGAFTLTLNPKDASGKTLSILRKSASPAWGGVICQYEAPILDVKPSEVPELSIRKSIVALVEGKNGELTPKEGIVLSKGMKVRVTLFITAGRDMDYVAVTDERSACLEPVEQLSGYTVSDRVGFYREVRDAQTNLFFGWLPKGTHVVSYDCTVSQDGTFSCGIATAQSQYSPSTVAHSSGSIIQVK